MGRRIAHGRLLLPRRALGAGLDDRSTDVRFPRVDVGGRRYARGMSTVHLLRFDSPVGRIELLGDDEAITSLSIERDGALPHDGLPEQPNPLLERARAQLSEYFAGERTDFDLPVRPLGGTDFQRAVWSELARLQWGEATSYGALAAAVGRPGSARAIGGAVGANPVPIIIGCHRVLASDGRITGYSGGDGIPTKLWLLGHEQIGFAA